MGGVLFCGSQIISITAWGMKRFENWSSKLSSAITKWNMTSPTHGWSLWKYTTNIEAKTKN